MKAVSNVIPAAPPIASSDAASDVLRLEFKRNMGQISRQSSVFFAGTLFTMAAGYLVKVYVARVLGAEQLGLYALGMTIVSLTQLVASVGLQGAAARYIAVYKATGKLNDLRGFLTRSVTIVVCLNLIFSAGFVVWGRWIAHSLYHAPGLEPYLPLFAALTILGSLNVFYCQVLAGFKDVAKRTIITNFIGSPVVMVLTVVLLALGAQMWGYLAAQIISSAIVVLLLVMVAWKLTPRAARFSWAPLPPSDPEIRAFAAAAFGMSALDFLVSQADKIMLGLYLNPSLVGIYVLASTLSAFIPIILQSVNQIFAPIIADLHAQNRRDVLERLFQTLTKWVVALTIPLAFAVIAFARPLMRIFGPGFEPGWTVLVIAALGQLVNCGVGSVGYLLLMSGNQRRLIKVQFTMAGITILANILLIPALGIIGAAIVSAGVNVCGNVWNLSEVRKALQISPYNAGYFALLLPTIGTAVTLSILRFWTGLVIHPWLAIMAALVLSYVVFGGLALRYALDADDRMIARSAWLQLRGGMQRIGVTAA
jgi:O-antigen/teichoic acid export membrane protein